MSVSWKHTTFRPSTTELAKMKAQLPDYNQRLYWRFWPSRSSEVALSERRQIDFFSIPQSRILDLSSCP